MKQKKKLPTKKVAAPKKQRFSNWIIFGAVILFICLFIIVANANQRQDLTGNAASAITPTFGQLGDCQTNGTCPQDSESPESGVASISPGSAVTTSPTNATIQPCNAAKDAQVSTMAKHRNKNGKGKGNNAGGNGFIQLILQFLQQLLQFLQQLLGGTIPSPTPIPGGNQPSPVAGGPNPSSSPCPPTNPQPTTPGQQSPTNVPTSVPAPTTPVTSATCTKPTQVLQMDPNDPQAGVTIGNFYMTNDTWNAANYSVSQSISICSPSSWFATAKMDNSKGDGAVKTYPNEHEDINKPLNSFSTITSTFAESGPHVGIYEYTYDLWLNGFDNGSTEVMIWNDNFNQTPSGSKQGTFTDNGHTYDVWSDGSGYVAFVAQSNFTTGTVNILNFFNYVVSKGWASANSTVTQLDYGIELVSTNAQSAVFNVNNFTLTAQ